MKDLRIGVILTEGFSLSALSIFADHLYVPIETGVRAAPQQLGLKFMAANPTRVTADCGVILKSDSDLLAPHLLVYAEGPVTDPRAFGPPCDVR